MHSISFLLRVCDRAGMNISAKNTEVLCLSTNPRHCMLQVSGSTRQQVEKFKYLGVVAYFRLAERGDDTRIGKANAVLRELYRSVVTKRSFETPQNCQFLNRSLFRSLPMFMNLG